MIPEMMDSTPFFMDQIFQKAKDPGVFFFSVSSTCSTCFFAEDNLRLQMPSPDVVDRCGDVGLM